MRKVVVNSSPLIALSGIEKLDLLQKMYNEILIPEAVYREISAKENSKCKQTIDDSQKWIRVCSIEDQLAKTFFKSRLHAGEVEAMILAKEQAADLLIIDDALAKKHAAYMKINVVGTLGILIKARKLELIDSLCPLIEQMRSNHIYMSDELIKMCLHTVGEL